MASKQFQRKQTTQLELPDFEISAKTSKPAMWRIDSKVLRGKLLSQLPLKEGGHVNNRELLLSPLTEDADSDVQIAEGDRSPSQVNINDRGPPKLKPDSHDDRSPSKLKAHSDDDWNTSQLKPPSNNDRSPSQLKPHSDNERNPTHLKPGSHDDRSPSLLKPHSNHDRDFLSFRPHSTINGRVCSISPPDDRAITSCGLPDGSDVLLNTRLQKKLSFAERANSRDSMYSLENEVSPSPSVLAPLYQKGSLQSPMPPFVSQRVITSSPSGQQRSRSLRRYDTTRSFNVQKKRHRNSDSIRSLPEVSLDRQYVLENRMLAKRRTGLTLVQSTELLATPDNAGFHSALSSDGESSTGSTFSTLEGSRRLRHRALSPSLSRSTSRAIMSPSPFSRSVSRASMSRSFTRRQLNLMQMEKNRFSKEELREKFRYALRMIRFMVRLELSLKYYSRNVDQQQTIEQLNYYSREAEFSSEKLVFNKTNFAASNVVYMPPWARRMLALPPSERNSKDIHHLATMLKAMKFFKNGIQMDRLYDLCRHCTYNRYEKQRVLIRTGHLSQYTYLLFSGSVFVNIEENDSENGRKYYRTAAVLGKGTVFGEIAVIHKVPRTANIIARENIEVLVVDPPTCFRIFPEEINREYNLTLENMRLTELFKDWPIKALNDLCLVSKRNQYPFGAIIEKNTKDSEFIYLVAKGRVELVCDVPLCRVTSALNTSTQQPEHNLAKLIDCPPDHAYLPPIPSHSPKLMCQETLSEAMKKGSALVSVDSLLPYQVCDLVSLLKTRQANTLMLISRGSDVIRIPKLRLQTIPPRKYWKDILEIARNTAKYPGCAVLTRLFVEHHQWTAYRKIVLQDTLKTIPGVTLKEKKEAKKEKKIKSAIPNIVLELIDEDSGHAKGCYEKCLSSKEPIHNMKSHHHEGYCLRTWQGECNSSRSQKTLTKLRSQRRAFSLT